MLKLKRERFIIGALVALSSTTWAGTGGAPQDLNPKLNAAQAYAGPLLAKVGGSAYESAVLRAASLSGIQVDSTAKNPTIELALSDLPLYSVSTAKNQITFDLMDTIVLDDLEKMYLDGGNLVSNVTAEQVSASPQFVTRITLDTNRAFSIQTKNVGDTLRITMLPQSDKLDAQLADAQAKRIPALLAATVSEYQQRHANNYASLIADYERINAKISTTLETAKLKNLEMELLNSKSDSSSTAELDASVAKLKRDFELRKLNYSQLQKKVTSEQVIKDKSLDQLTASTVTTLQASLTEMSAIVDTLSTKVASSKRLLAKTEQRSTPLASKDRFSSLDSAFEALDAEKAPASTNLDALQTALNTVEEASTVIPLDTTANAAINLSSEERANIMPPTKRMRPAQHSLSAKSSTNVGTLSASADELAKAQSNGNIVLAQAETLDDTSAPVDEKTSKYQPRKSPVNPKRVNRPDFYLYNENLPADQDPLRQLVNLDFTDMPLNKVVSLLAQKGQINVISGTEISGTVTANLKEIPLGRAIEIVLRMNGLGIIEESGVYRITTYEEAVATYYDTEMIFLQQAEASAVKATLDEIVNQGGGSGDRVRIGVNTQSNILILSGPRDRLNELIEIIEQLDVAKQVIPTINKVIQLNYSNTDEIVEIITPILSENGQITEETRSGQVIVTDIPVKIEEITALVKEIDIPVEQVSIEAMVVDHVVDDKAESGVNLVGFSDGLTDIVQGESEEPIRHFGFNSFLEGPATGGLMEFGFVVNDFELGGIISAELNNSDSELLANPVVVTLENQKASINISQEFPFRETQETGNGGVVSSTEFKDIGTVLEVTPQITFDRKIIAEIAAKQSNLIGFTQDGIPIEAKREAETTMRMEDGQTVYIAGLRRYDESIGDSKVPFLGDIPVLNIFFKKHKSEKTNNELMVFLTCNIIKDEFTELTPFEKEQYDLLGGKPLDETNAMRSMIDAYGKDPIRDPFYKWRRAK